MDKAGLFLFRVKSGRGVVELPDATFDLEPGATWWLLDLARSRRYVPAAGTRLVTMSVRFSGPGIETWRDEIFRGRSGFVLGGARQSTRLRKASNELMRLASNSPAQAEWRMHEIIMCVLGILFQAHGLPEGAQLHPHPPTRRVMEAVQANPLRAWRADELASLAGVGYSSLRKHFKETQGETLHAFVQRVRLEQARLRLTDLRLSVKEIAVQMNFSSEFYFSRWFHHATGTRPSRFRAMLRG